MDEVLGKLVFKIENKIARGIEKRVTPATFTL